MTNTNLKNTALNVLLFGVVTVPLGHVTAILAYVLGEARVGRPHPPLAFAQQLLDSLINLVIPTFWLACVVLWIMFGGLVTSRIANSTRPVFTGLASALTVGVVAYVITVTFWWLFYQRDPSWDWLLLVLMETLRLNFGTMFWLILQGAFMDRYLRWFS